MNLELDPTKWTPDERQAFLARGFRALRDGEQPICSAFARPDDYQHDLGRGSVKFDPGWSNYSFHTVAIPDGSFVQGVNFSQATPNTLGITGKQLTLINCNLTNVRIDLSWTLKDCNTAQSWIVITPIDGVPTPKRQYVCEHPNRLTGNEQIPQTAVLVGIDAGAQAQATAAADAIAKIKGLK